MAPVHRLRSAGRLNLVIGSSLGPCCNPKSSAACSIHNVNGMDNVVRNPHRPSQNIPVHKHYSIIYIYVRDIMKYHILYTFMYTYLYIDCNLCHNWSPLPSSSVMSAIRCQGRTWHIRPRGPNCWQRACSKTDLEGKKNSTATVVETNIYKYNILLYNLD